MSVVGMILGGIVVLCVGISVLNTVFGIFGELFGAIGHVVRGDKLPSYYDDTSNPHGKV